MDVHWDSSLPSWFTNAIYCDNFNQLTIDGLAASAGPKAPANEAVVSLHNGHKVSLDHIKLQTDNTIPTPIQPKLILQDNAGN